MAISDKLRKKLEKRRKEVAQNSKGGFDYLVFKEGVTRIRPLPVGEEEEPGFPVTHFYLGQDIKGVISPATFGEPCAIMEAYEELRKGDASDKELADGFKPKEKYMMACIKYTDEKGKEIDERLGVTMALFSGPQYQQTLDLFLDDEEWGDFTDPKEGYDLKISREGKGKMDTRYTINPTNKRPIPKNDAKYGKKPVDIETMVRAITPDYEKTEELVKQYLNMDFGDDDDAPKKKSKKSSKEGKAGKSKKKKSRKTSDDD
jgi:hypothetical protein